MTGTWLAFGKYRFDPRSGELADPSETLKLRPQAAKALALLVGAAGELVSRERLRDELWPDERIVLYEVSISTVIRELRRALGDDPRRARYIETLPRRGYRFIAPVTVTTTDRVAARTPLSTEHPRTGSIGRLARAFGFLALLIIMPLLGGTASVPVSVSKDGGGYQSGVSLSLHAFRALTDDPASTRFARALDEELATMLAAANLPDLRVASDRRNGSGSAPRRSHLLEGSVRSEDKTLLITVRVASAADGGLIWSERYRRDADKASIASREVAARIAQGVLDDVAPRAEHRPKPEAQTAYARARTLLSRHTATATEDAITALKRAVAADPGDARAWSALAKALLKWPGLAKSAEVVARAREAAERSIALDPAQADAERALGEIALYVDWNWDEAGRRLERAVALAPADAGIRDLRAAWLSARGHHAQALREIELAEALDPAAVAVSFDVMLFHYFARDYPGTIAAARRLALLWPGNYASDRYILLAYEAGGQEQAAKDYAARTLDSWNRRRAEAQLSVPEGGDPLVRLWERVLAAVRKQEQAGRPIDPLAPVTAYAQLDRPDEAIARIESASDGRFFSYIVPFLGVSPALDPLRGDPRFEYELRALGEAALTDYYDSGTVARREGR